MPIYGDREYLLPDYSGDVVKIDGVCYIFDGYASSGEPDILDSDASRYDTCEDCSAIAVSEVPSSTTPSTLVVSSSSVSISLYECLEWARLDNCFVATEPYTYEGAWTGEEGGYWYELKDAVDDLAEGPQTISFTWTLQKYTRGSPWHAPIFELKEDPVADVSAERSTTGNPVTKAEFLAEIQSAFDQWKAAFEFAYSPSFGFSNQLTVEFTYTGDENSNPSLTRGDFRFGMEDLSALAHASYPLRYAKIGNGAGGTVLHFDRGSPWSKDSSNKHRGDTNSYSIAYVAAHEIGHSLGFKHNESFKGTPVYATHSYKSVLFPTVVNRSHIYGAGRLDKSWGGGGLVKSYEDVRGIHEVYGMPTVPIYSCTWACMDDLLNGASSSVAGFVDGDVLKIDGVCYSFIDVHTGPSDSLPSCSSGSTRVLSSPTLDDVFDGCFDCASGLPDDVLDPLLSAKDDGQQALVDQRPIEENSSSSDSSVLDLSGRVTLINDDAAMPDMTLALHCQDEEVWCIPSYYIDQFIPGETFEVHFDVSSSACFTMLEEGSSSPYCDVVFDFLSPPINVLGPYFDCLDCVGAVLDTSPSSSSAEEFGLVLETGENFITEDGETLTLE